MIIICQKQIINSNTNTKTYTKLLKKEETLQQSIK